MQRLGLLDTWTTYFTILVLIGSSRCKEPALEAEYIHGIIENTANNIKGSPIFYETYVPMLFEYTLPDYSVSSLELTTYRTVTDYTGLCDKSKFDDKCPTWYYMDTVLRDQFSPNLTWWLSAKNQSTSVSNPEDNLFCSSIGTHFSNFTITTTEEINNYFLKLKECPMNDELLSRTELPNSSRAIQDYYDEMSRNTGEAYWFLPSKVDAAASLNMQLATYAIFLLNQYMESNRWKEAFQKCKSGTIPSSIISESSLASQLKKLQSKLAMKNSKLSIPVNDINTYFSQTLADCVFTNDSMILRVLVPIRSNVNNYSSFVFQAVPFVNEKKEICFVSDINNNQNYLYEKNKKFMKKTNCKPNELCKIDAFEGSFIEDACVYSYLVGNHSTSTSNVKNLCPLKCLPSFLPQNLILQKISSDTVILVSGNIVNFTLKCDSGSADTLTTANYGALKVVVPCGCKIIYNSTDYFQSTTPCTNEKTIKQILPNTWRSNDNSADSDYDLITTSRTTIPKNEDAATQPTTKANSYDVPTVEPHHKNEIPDVNPQVYYVNNGSSTTLFTIVFLVLVVLSVLIGALNYKIRSLESRLHRKNSSGSDDTACIMNGEFYEASSI